jgi:hypothetical protein
VSTTKGSIKASNDNNVTEKQLISQQKLRTVKENPRAIDKLFFKFQEFFNEKQWSEISYDIVLVILIIGFALFIRLLLAYQFRVKYGYSAISNPWNRGLPFNVEGVYIEGFADFGHYYKSWITGWFEEHWYPFEWAEPIDKMDFYSYPPIFLYFLVLIWRPGMSELWMAFPMIIADAACAGAVYLIIKQLFNSEQRRPLAFLGGFLMGIAPINVIYDGVWWLNPGPVTLFTIIAFYFAMKQQWWQSFFWLALATMTKQNALFFTYPLFLTMLGSKVRQKQLGDAIIESIMNALLYVFTAIIVSFPWIVISPSQYVRHMLFPGKSIELTTTIVDPAPNQCVSFSRSLQEIGIGGWLLDFFAFGTNSMFLMVFVASIIAVSMSWRAYDEAFTKVEFFEWIAPYTIAAHIFMPRGVYKFYTAYYVPMILIALLGSFAAVSSKKRDLMITLPIAMGLFLGFNIGLLLINRFLVPFFLFIVALTIALIAVVRSYITDPSKMIIPRNPLVLGHI